MNASKPISIDGVEECAQALSTVIINIGGMYGDTLIHSLDEINQAFLDALPDIADYCESHRIKVNGIDAVKLFAFAIPHLKTAAPAANIGRYVTACFLAILGRSSGRLPPLLEDTVKVCEQFSRDVPSNHSKIYCYMKGLQEGIDLTEEA